MKFHNNLLKKREKMQFYKLVTLGKFTEDKYCFAGDEIEGLIGKAHKFLVDGGSSLKDLYPEDPFEVKVNLDEDSPKAITKGDFISNTDSHVIVSQEVEDELKKHNIGEVEFWPFTLINHKGRVHSKNYRFVVPVHQFDAINEELSEFTRTKNGVVTRISRIVLDNSKLDNAPDMFRINDLGEMAFFEPLMEILVNNYSNFVFEKLEQE
jgi:hypothetical protein